jgi:hypothetical protein
MEKCITINRTIASVEDLQKALQSFVEATAAWGRTRHPSELYMPNVKSVALIEKTLSDGSTVFDVEINTAE